MASSEAAGHDAAPASTQQNWHAYSIASLYDSIGRTYEVAYADIPLQLKSLDWLLAELPAPGCNILDIGCGTGQPVASTLSRAPGSHHVLGIDISPEMLSAARSSVPLATFQLIDFRHFNAGPGEFDAVTSYFAFLVAMSQEEIRDMFRKIFVWLKPGGLLVFSTIPADMEHHWQKWLGRTAVFSYLSKDQYKELLVDLGFVINHMEVQKFMPNAAENALCESEEVMVEPQLYIFARKLLSKGAAA